MKYIFLTIVFFICLQYKAQTPAVDSLLKVLKTAKEDTNKVNHLNNLSRELIYQKPDTFTLLANQALSLSIKLHWKKGMAIAFYNLGIYNYLKNDYHVALNYYFKALKGAEEIGDKSRIAIILGCIGIVYKEQGNFSKALDYYFKALKITEEIGDKGGAATWLGNIGVVYIGQGEHLKALEYYFKALKIVEELENKNQIATWNGNIGIVYKEQGNFSKALDYYFKALKITEEIGDKNGMAIWSGNLGVAYDEKEDYPRALEYYFKALNIHKELGNKNGIAIWQSNIGSLYTQNGKYEEAEKYLFKALELSKEIGVQDIERQIEEFISELYEKTGREKLALEHYKKAIALKDSIFSEENKKELIRKEMNFQFEKKEAVSNAEHKKELEKQSALATEQSRREKIIRYSVIGGLLMMFIIATIFFRSLQITRKQKKLVEKHKEIVEIKHKEITDSINYAERIQRSFLATTEMLDISLKDYFVFFRPKDVVSGDFYWAGELNNGNFAFSCADSTGHGVPGAIMSILNISSLEKSIERETEPHKILNQTRRIIIDRLKKDGSKEGGKDGMDCSLFVINKDKTQLSFSMANNPVFIVRLTVIASEERTKQSASSEEIASLPTVARNDDNEGVARNDDYQLFEYKPDKMPVGKHEKENEPFTLHTLQLQKGDIIYALTDGFQDQFGGSKGKKFKIKNLKELLLQIAHLPMHEQEQKLAEEFATWKGSNEQVDDVCLIGVRI